MNKQGKMQTPSTPPGSGCSPFPANGFLCGALGGIFPASPQVYNVGRNCGTCQDHEENGMAMEAAMVSLDDKFRPHLCEEQEFYVTKNGTISADAESLSLPSFSQDVTAKSESPPRREGVPKSSNESPGQNMDAPYSSMLYFMNEKRPKPVAPTGLKGNEFLPSMKNDKSKNIQNTQQHPDSERLRNLVAINRISPDKSEPGTKNSLVEHLRGAKSYVPSVVQPCMAPPQPQQPPESMVVYSEDYEAGQIQHYFQERFEQAATKVIRKSSDSCMKSLDPSLPRESDAQKRLEMELQCVHADKLKTRQQYRGVLKKYKKYRLLVLILKPSCKLYEVLELPFRPGETTIADVLTMAQIQTTDDRLRYQKYVGLCRPQLEPPPPPKTPPRYPNSSNTFAIPPRVPKFSRVSASGYSYSSDDDAERDRESHSMSSESTTNTRNHSYACYQESTYTENLVASILPTQSRLPSTSAAEMWQNGLASVLPSLPFLGDIVVTIPQGYSGDEVAKYALTILQSPMFLRWLHNRYLIDLQRDHDELLSLAAGLDTKQPRAITN